MLAAIPNPGRDNPVPVGGFIQEWWVASSRYGGRHNLGIVGGFVRNQHTSPKMIEQYYGHDDVEDYRDELRAKMR